MALPVSDWAKQPGYTGADGPWYVNADSAELAYEPGVLGRIEGFVNQAVGWYGFSTEADAAAALKTMTGKTATTSLKQATSNELGQTGSDVLSGATGLLGLPHLTSAQWRAYLLRGLKVAIGLVLIVVGLTQLTGARLPKAVPVPV
jgi:hypothetical protein